LEEYVQENHENDPNEKEILKESDFAQSPEEENMKIDVVVESEPPYRPPNYEDVVNNDLTVEKRFQ